FAEKAPALHVVERKLGKARIDAGKDHRLIIPFRTEGDERKRGNQACAPGRLEEGATVEPPAQQVAATQTCRWMDNGHCRGSDEVLDKRASRTPFHAGPPGSARRHYRNRESAASAISAAPRQGE